MNETMKAIAECGIFVVIASAFIWMAFKKDRDYAKAVREFAKVMAQSNNIISNHIEDDTAAMRELAKVIDRLCIYMEMPNRDYRKRDG